MNNDSVLKKEFKKSDVERVRNLVKKDYTSSTKQQTGYRKSSKRYKEGDVWEENGKKWTIKNGIKQNITKLDQAKKTLRIPLRCPKCNGPLKHWLDKKMYKIHGFCGNTCTVKMEGKLKLAGLYDDYVKRIKQGNMKGFITDVESWANELVNSKNSFVTEDGEIEKWKSNSQMDRKFMKNLKEYISYLSEHLK